MSPSSTRRRGPRLRAAQAAGLCIGREHVSYTQIARASQDWELLRVGEAQTSGRLFVGDSSAAGGTLVPALRAAIGDEPSGFGPLHVSIPDAAVRVNVFELDEVPASRAAQEAFVEFRMGREAGAAKSRYTSQLLGRVADGKQLLLGMAFDEGWYVAIERALEQAGLRAWSLNANAFRYFNLHYESLAGSSGALIVLEPDSWSLAVWDAAGLLRYSRAEWRTEDLSHEEIAAETERAILGYVHGEGGRTVDKIWVCGGADTSEFTALLNTRTSQACQVLELGERRPSVGSSPDEVLRSTASLVAALQP